MNVQLVRQLRRKHQFHPLLTSTFRRPLHYAFCIKQSSVNVMWSINLPTAIQPSPTRFPKFTSSSSNFSAKLLHRLGDWDHWVENIAGLFSFIDYQVDIKTITVWCVQYQLRFLFMCHAIFIFSYFCLATPPSALLSGSKNLCLLTVKNTRRKW